MQKKSNAGWNDRQKSGRTVYQRGSQRDGSPHYVLLYSDDEHSGDENIPLQSQNHTHSSPRKVEVMKIEVQPEDTLQALALRYGCTISELKRVNNIHNDNEIFARPLIKVPVQPFSFLTETLNDIQNDGTKGSTREVVKSSTSKEEQILNLISTPLTIVPPKSELNDIIFNSIIEPVSQTNVNEEVTSNVALLSPSERQVNSQPDVNNSFSCSGADWGLKWRHVLGIFLLIGIGLPIIYIFYITDVSKYSILENISQVNQT